MKSLEVKAAQARETLNKAVDTAGAFYLRHRTPINIGISILAAITLNGIADAATGGYAHVALASGPNTTPTPSTTLNPDQIHATATMQAVQNAIYHAATNPGSPGAQETVQAGAQIISAAQHLPTVTGTPVPVPPEISSVPGAQIDLAVVAGGMGQFAGWTADRIAQYVNWLLYSDTEWFFKGVALVPELAFGTLVGLLILNREEKDKKEGPSVNKWAVRRNDNGLTDAEQRDADKRLGVYYVKTFAHEHPDIFASVLPLLGYGRGNIDMDQPPYSLVEASWLLLDQKQRIQFKLTGGQGSFLAQVVHKQGKEIDSLKGRTGKLESRADKTDTSIDSLQTQNRHQDAEMARIMTVARRKQGSN